MLESIRWTGLGAPYLPVLVKAKGVSAQAFQRWIGNVCSEDRKLVDKCVQNLAGDPARGEKPFWLPPTLPGIRANGGWDEHAGRMNPSGLIWLNWLRSHLKTADTHESTESSIPKKLPDSLPPDVTLDEAGGIFSPKTDERFALLFPTEDPVQLAFSKDLIRYLDYQKLTLVKNTPAASINYSGYAYMVTEEGQHLQARFPLVNLAMLLMVGAVVFLFFPYLKPTLRLMGVMTFLGMVCIGLAGWLVGHINAISMSFVATVLGLGVNEGVYLLVLAGNLEKEDRLKKTIEVCPALFVTALTTAAGFGALFFLNVKAFEDLGLLSAISLVLCLLFMLSAWPHLMGPPIQKEPPLWSQQLVKGLVRLAPVMGFLLVAPIGALVWKGWATFDASFITLMPDLPAIQDYLNEKKGPLGSDVAVAKASTIQESAILAEKLEALPLVESVLAIRNSDSLERLPKISRLPSYENYPEKLKAEIQRAKNDLDDLVFEMELSGNKKDLEKTDSVKNLLDRTDALSPEESLHRSRVWDAIYAGSKDHMNGLMRLLHPKKDVYLLFIRPKENLLKESSFLALEKALKKTHADTWMPARLFFGFTLEVKNNILLTILAACLIAVMVIGGGQRSWWSLFEAFLPLLACGVSVYGVMTLMDWLGPVSVAAFPILVATCVDGPVLIRQTLDQEGGTGLYKAARGLALTMGTTAAAFAALVLLWHPGISRLGFLVAYGVTAAWVFSIWWTPWLYRFKTARKSTPQVGAGRGT